MTTQHGNEQPDAGWCGDRKRGASLGRRSDNPATWGVKRVELVSVWIDNGGYDPGGSYWGTGEPLWELVGEDCSHFFRCSGDREAVAAYVTDEWPDLTLYPAAVLDRKALADCEIDVTEIIAGNAIELPEPQAQAVRLHLDGFGCFDDAAAMGPAACASALFDLVQLEGDDYDFDDPNNSGRLYKGDDGRTYFYAGE